MSHLKKSDIKVSDGEYLTDDEIEKIVKKVKVPVKDEHYNSKETIKKLKRMGVSGYILWLRSSTKKKFPSFIFSAENDMLTQGLESLVSIDKFEIVHSGFSVYNQVVVEEDNAVELEKMAQYIVHPTFFANKIRYNKDTGKASYFWRF